MAVPLPRQRGAERGQLSSEVELIEGSFTRGGRDWTQDRACNTASESQSATSLWQFESFQLAKEGRSVDPEDPRCQRAIPPGCLEGAQDLPLFGFLERLGLLARLAVDRSLLCTAGSICLTDDRGLEDPAVVSNLSLTDDGARAEGHELQDLVLQLPDVPWPVVSQKQAEGRAVQVLARLSLLGGDLLEEVFDQQWDVLPPLAQGGDVDVRHVQPVEEVLAEEPFG